jgi:hypothetical protein
MHAPDRYVSVHRTEASYALDWWHHGTTKSEQRRRCEARRRHSRAVRRSTRVVVTLELDEVTFD